jgi:hypothetical protein
MAATDVFNVPLAWQRVGKWEGGAKLPRNLRGGPKERRRNLLDFFFTDDLGGYLRSFPALPAFFVRCQASHHEHRYARSSFGAWAVAIWCAAVARASPSLAYFRFPLTGHLDSLSTTRPMGCCMRI